MSTIQAQLSTSASSFRVEGYEKIEFDFQLVHQIFDIHQPDLASYYTALKRQGYFILDKGRKSF